MNVDPVSINGLFRGFNTSFNKGLKATTTHWSTIAMKVPSTSAATTYAWLGDMPGIREWIGDRVVHDLSASRYTIVNKTFEETVTVKRTAIEDDEYGVYGPLVEKMGRDTAMHPEEMVFNLLEDGFTTLCYDGQHFFDTDHPVRTAVNGQSVIGSVSNMQAGTDPAWYILDCSQPIKPLIYQERMPFEFTSLNAEEDAVVFVKDKYLYGVRGRSNAGFGLWQMAYASRAPLNEENYVAARTAMRKLKNDSGKALSLLPTHLVVPPELEGKARKLLMAEDWDSGVSNVWKGSAELIVTPYLG